MHVDGIYLSTLAFNVGIQQVAGEDAACQEEVVIGFQSIQSFGERTGHCGHAGCFLGRQLVDVLVQRLAWIYAILDAVQPGHEHRREGEIRVCRGVGAAELQPLRLRAVGIQRHTDGSRAVARRISQVHRSLVAGNQPLVRVGGGCSEGQHGRGVPQQTADVVAGRL